MDTTFENVYDLQDYFSMYSRRLTCPLSRPARYLGAEREDEENRLMMLGIYTA